VRIEYNSTNELGKVLATKTVGKKTMIYREYGVEKFTTAIDPIKCRLEVIATFPRRIINLRQADYRIKEAKNGGFVNGTKETIK
jgi:hypothetical protein